MNNLHQILLQPTDVLFFRDGRPMSGSLAGHSAAWPLPDIPNHALHAALHRAELVGTHRHRQGRSGEYLDQRDRQFGSLLTAGPFPVRIAEPAAASKPPRNAIHTWYFPRPKDSQLANSVAVTHLPVSSLPGMDRDAAWQSSSLPRPLRYGVANTQPPTKSTGAEAWISTAAFEAYLREQSGPEPHFFLRDTDLADTEHRIGIGIDPASGTTGRGAAEGQIYSAHYLRLREECRMGLFAQAIDKSNGSQDQPRDLIQELLNGSPRQIVVGGQQRICTASRTDVTDPLPLPKGMRSEFNTAHSADSKCWLVKWILLTPAIWPEIVGATSRSGETIHPHPGGWLPNWIFVDWDTEARQSRPNERNGQVLLKLRSGRRHRDYTGTRIRRVAEREAPLSARLVAAIVPKPLPVTGWALPNAANCFEGGAKSTHLAVPAGAVFYFEADTEADADNLAAALNWHGSDTSFTTLCNRRSTLMGEKGFGLGVCGTWKFLGT
ncbi:MAG: hypothetical protein KF833_13905 [Verrucomicrobiae bacterium]|nr:hypothetical protein [Verrucomicrobiae bacterium]